ncbi:hypothetical protein [Wolbachia endosymbiont (group A) of Barypeithes pellucidus]|uniref:hypothetical protein n=1 Tax=Wolbachia endosymbiont (group A) of Barypeithes pellucidus TaxID=3139322 RepID=UPI003CCB58C3
MQELTRSDYLDLAVSSSEQKQRANSLDYLNIDNDVPKQPDHLSIDAAKRYLMSLSEDQDVFYDAESGDAKDTEAPSPANEPAKLDDVAVSNLSDKNSKKEENGQGWFAWSLGKAKSVMTEVVVGCTVLECDGMIKYEKKIPSKEELWDKYYMGAPKQHRRFVEQYKIEKRA